MDTVIVVVTGVLLLCFAYVAVRLVRAGKPGADAKGSGHPSTRGKKAARPEKVYPARRNPYRATSIVNERNPCSAVTRLLNVRFLDLDKRLPSLPVAGCNATKCHCKYAHHDDRRDEDSDRRSFNALTSNLFEHSGKENKRSSRGGRRKTDLSNRLIQYSEFNDKNR